MLAPGAIPFTPPELRWLLAGALAGYALMMWTNPVRTALRDAWRAVLRYPALALAPGALGFAHAAFDLAMRGYLYTVLPEDTRPVFVWVREAWHDPQLWLTGSPESLWWLSHGDFVQAVLGSMLPAFESVAGLFNCVVITFPFSAIAALLLFANWQRHHTTRRCLTSH